MQVRFLWSICDKDVRAHALFISYWYLYVHIFTDRCKSKLNKQHNMYKLNAFANSWFQSSNREVDITK